MASTSDECIICTRPHEILIQLCPKCKMTSCKSCSDKWIHLSGFQCTTCRVSIPRLKYFFAGKISGGYGGYGEAGEAGSYLPTSNGRFRYDDPTRIKIAIDDKSDSGTDIYDFKNLEKPLTYRENVKCITTGPYQIGHTFCIDCGGMTVNNKCTTCDQTECRSGEYTGEHGFGFHTGSIKECLSDIRILIQRNKEMIHACDIFSMRINRDFDCERSKAEWGIALGQNKIMMIYFEHVDEYDDIVDLSKDLSKIEEDWNELVDSDDDDDDDDDDYVDLSKFELGWPIYEIYDSSKCAVDISRKGKDAKQCSNKKCGRNDLCKKHLDEYDNLIKLDQKLKLKTVYKHYLRCAEFYIYIQECLDSLQGLDDRMKEFVIYCHPVLSKRFGGYKDYKKYLEDIFQLKK
jgi:hypothetical protein